MYLSARETLTGTPYEASDFDFRLKAGSKAVDAGVPLSNINYAFASKAPDLGAYEAGHHVPVYGPRGAGGPPFYR
jgi:hypothetical protein